MFEAYLLSLTQIARISPCVQLRSTSDTNLTLFLHLSHAVLISWHLIEINRLDAHNGKSEACTLVHLRDIVVVEHP